MPNVDVSKCPSVDVALRRLKRMCDRYGIHKRMRELQHHVKDAVGRRRAKAAAVKRRQKDQSLQAQILAGGKKEKRRR